MVRAADQYRVCPWFDFLLKELFMSKWMAMAALGMMLAVVGCDKNKTDTSTTTSSSDAKKMSTSSKSSASCSECDAAAKKTTAAK